MCIIVDASKMGDFLNPEHQDSAPIRKWLRKNGRLVYSTGGRFAKEIGISGKYKTGLVEYVRAGKARHIPYEQFAEDEKKLINGHIRSNDPHVLALARFTRTRLLYTGDPELIKDFNDKKLIDDPRGKVYSTAKNADLLTDQVCANLRI